MTAKYYHQFYTLNDNALADVIDVMLLAAEVYGDAAPLAPAGTAASVVRGEGSGVRGSSLGERCRRAAEQAGDFLILAQLPEPQPA